MQAISDAELSSVITRTVGTVLVCDPPEPDRDFFSLGGDSVRAVELVTRLTEEFQARTPDDGQELSAALLLAIFDDASLAALATVLSAHLRPE